MKRFFLVLFFCFVSRVSHASNDIYLHVNLHPYSLGMFSVFSFVAGVLYEYDTCDYAGICVDFGKFGLYYDSDLGSNWWEYYCIPIRIGNKEGNIIKSFTIDEYVSYAYFLQRELSREQVYQLIEKYIHIQDAVQKKINMFILEHFGDGYVIGVHYRGTDKKAEAPRVGYREVSDSVRKCMQENHIQKCKIFVATDESPFLEFMYQEFGSSVITYSTMRSDNEQALHVKQANKYLHGEEALIDCILLSRGNILIRTSSNLSLWSTYFNPKLPVIALSERYNY